MNATAHATLTKAHPAWPASIALPPSLIPTRVRSTAVARCPRRGLRVGALLVLVVLCSLGDLYMTLVHLVGPGMFEGNPLARQVMGLGSPMLLIGYKLLTVGFGAGVLWWFRHRRSAEVAAWFCAAVLVWLTVRWTEYSDGVAMYSSELAAAMQVGSGSRFVAPLQP